jgi:hypothetical protein
MEIIEVSDQRTVKAFHQVPEKIYRNDPDYIPLLHPLIEDSFNPLKNAKYKKGNACRWILKRNHEVIGRIAAFYDQVYASGYDQPTGCCGFFECIDDHDAAGMLFDTAKNWLENNGMEAMDGPVNFGENFFYWGLLVEHFQPQTFGMPYNPPYYRKLFESYGFKTYYEQYSYSLDITNPDLPERFWKIAAWVSKKPGYSYRHFSFEDEDKLIRDFIDIHKQAWSGHSNYEPADFEQLKALINQSKFILEEEFIWYVYHNDKPIAFYMMIPDVNQILIKFKTGRLNFCNILKLFYYKRKKIIKRCRVIVLGVIPQYQRLGIESGIFYRLKEVMLRKPWYNDMEMSWIADFNPKMIALFKSFGAEKTCTHLTLRYLFDRKKEFKRAEII